MIITISGPPGSGKTTVGRLVAKSLGCPFKSTGEAFRAIAEERKVSLAKLGELAEKDHNIDVELDRRVIKALVEPMVLEGRLAAHMCVRSGVQAFKIWVDAPVEIRAARIAEREKKKPGAVKKAMLVREKSESTRYREIYGIDFSDISVYDLVLDSRTESAEALAKFVVAEVMRRA
ncbi:MAG: cytidylate kinase family protein [Methanobacteriota archaeon]